MYGYNGLNQLVSASENGLTSSYTYDGTGLRQSKTVNGTTTTHIWDGTNIVAESNGAYILKRYYRGANGVFLPTTKNISEGTYHPSLHTKEYSAKITNMLGAAESREDVISILSVIKNKLKNGTLMQ